MRTVSEHSPNVVADAARPRVGRLGPGDRLLGVDEIGEGAVYSRPG